MQDFYDPFEDSDLTITEDQIESLTYCPGNEDTMHVSVYPSFIDKVKFDGFITRAEQAQENARKMPKLGEKPNIDDEIETTYFVETTSYTYTVKPQGFNAAKKFGNQYGWYPLVIKDGGVMLGINKSTCGKESKCPGIRVEIGSLPLTIAGSAEEMWSEIHHRLEEIGLKIDRNILSRIDPCVDAPFRIDPLQKAIQNEFFITPARSNAHYTEKLNENTLLASEETDTSITSHQKARRNTGFSIGKDQIMCRVYDKWAEASHKEHLLLILNQRRAKEQEDIPEFLTRCEFQLRREALASFVIMGEKCGIESVEDWIKYKAEIMHYLCNRWLIITAEEPNRRHTEKIKDDPEEWHPHWLHICDLIQDTYGSHRTKCSRIKKDTTKEQRKLIVQAIGCFQSAMIGKGYALNNPDMPNSNWKEEFSEWCAAHILWALQDQKTCDNFWDNLRSKIAEKEASVPTLDKHDEYDEFLAASYSHSPDILREIASWKYSQEIRGAGVTHAAPAVAVHDGEMRPEVRITPPQLR